MVFVGRAMSGIIHLRRVKPATAAHNAVEGEGRAATGKGTEKAVVEKDEKVTASAKPDKSAAEKKAGH